jgi:hypothetical protein
MGQQLDEQVAFAISSAAQTSCKQTTSGETQVVE